MQKTMASKSDVQNICFLLWCRIFYVMANAVESQNVYFDFAGHYKTI